MKPPKLSKKEIKAGSDRATMLASAMFIVLYPEAPPVWGATIASLTATWLMTIHKDDRAGALQNLHHIVADMTADMEKEEAKR